MNQPVDPIRRPLVPNLGGIHIDFPLTGSGEQARVQVKDARVPNVRSAIITEHVFRKGIIPDTFTAEIHHRCGSVQTLRFEHDGLRCIVAMTGRKPYKDFVIHGMLSMDKGALYLRWSRKQKAGSVLVIASYWAGSRGANEPVQKL